MQAKEDGAGHGLHRRTFLKLGIVASTTTALGVLAFRREGSALPAADAHRALYEAEDFWGMIASRDQWSEPVTTGWTWGNYETWQVPRREEDIIGASVFSQGATAVTCAAGAEIWQDIVVPSGATYKLFLRVLNYRRDGINAVTVKVNNQSRSTEWGPGWFVRYPSRMVAKFQRSASLLEWIDVGHFDLDKGTNRLSITADQVGQHLLFVDSVYFTADLNEAEPERWNPLVVPPTSTGTPIKTRRTMRTDLEIAAARERVSKFGWAKTELEKTLDFAQPFTEMSNEALWQLTPSTTLARSKEIESRCPEHGAFANGAQWQIDPFNHNQRLRCPVGEEWRTTNSGPANSDAYFFYRLYSDYIRPGVESVGKAFALTGDQKYARAAAILLARIADEYPNGFDRRARSFRKPYSSGSGTITDNVSAAYDLPAFATAYDAIFDRIDADDELIRFLRSKNRDLRSGTDIRYWIEERLLRVMAQAVLDKAINANTGIHDRALMAVALCLDDLDSNRYPNSLEMIEWLYYGQRAQGDNWSGPRKYFANYLLPDGSIYDASVDYSSLALFFVDCFDWLERLRKLHPHEISTDRYPRLISHERLRNHIDFLTGVVCLERYHLTCGDGHGRALWEGHNLNPLSSNANAHVVASDEAAVNCDRTSVAV
jgi:hypothetical protein